MRFVSDGPILPNDLLREWRQGRVLFLAGAGVSQPAGLPLFKGLALEVYETLSDRLYDVLRLDDGKKLLYSLPDLSAAQRAEGELYFSNDIDRLFSAIERRIDHDRRGRLTGRRVRQAVSNILRGTKGTTNGHKDLLALSVPMNDEEVQCRIVTTNFDLLFEKAWKSEFGSSAVTHDSRVAPRAGAHNFEGIVHLHGMLRAKNSDFADLVLSSRDFARFYLRSGVVANYVYDLMRRYTLVLVGYSAEDPPMRYLMDAIGEDASLFADLRKPFAIAEWKRSVDDPTGALTAERWNIKNINPILYSTRAGSFAPLWETISIWSQWARRDDEWVHETLLAHSRGAYGSAPSFNREFVQDVLSLLSQDERNAAIKRMADSRVEFGWIEAIDASFRSATV